MISKRRRWSLNPDQQAPEPELKQYTVPCWPWGETRTKRELLISLTPQENPLPSHYHNPLSFACDRTAVQNTSLQLTAPVPADSFCPKCKSSQWTQNSSLHVPIWGRWMGLPASSWGLPGHSRSFQDSFLLKLCLQATITIQCPLHPREEGVLPSCSSLPIQLPPCSLFCRPAQTALSLLSYHFLSYIRIIQPHTLFLLLSGKQGRNIFFSSLSSPQHLHFVTWVLSLLSHTQ